MLQREVVPNQYVGDERGFSATPLLKPQQAQRAPTQYMLAVRDVVGGARLWYVWGTLAWHDIRQRYRRSKIGPFWLTVNMSVMIGAFGGLYAGLFRTEVAQYLPHVAIGFVVWGLVSGLTNDGCNAFIESQGSIKQVRLPLSVYVYRVVSRNMMIFCHNALIIVVVLVVFAIRPGWIALLAVPAVAVLCLNGVWAGLLLGLLSARFRDVPQIVTNALQVVFFLTPIIWQPQLLPDRALVLTFNPFFYALELVRAPLLGTIPPLRFWLVVLALTGAGTAVALVMFARYRRRIAYWI